MYSQSPRICFREYVPLLMVKISTQGFDRFRPSECRSTSCEDDSLLLSSLLSPLSTSFPSYPLSPLLSSPPFSRSTSPAMEADPDTFVASGQLFLCEKCLHPNFTTYNAAYDHILTDPRHATHVAAIRLRYGSRREGQYIDRLIKVLLIPDDATEVRIKALASAERTISLAATTGGAGGFPQAMSIRNHNDVSTSPPSFLIILHRGVVLTCFSIELQIQCPNRLRQRSRPGHRGRCGGSGAAENQSEDLRAPEIRIGTECQPVLFPLQSRPDGAGANASCGTGCYCRTV